MNPFAEDQTENFNTPLSPTQEQAFQQWRAALPRNLQSTRDYDLRRAWLANASEAANRHLTDIGKKPNHYTWSSDSQIQPQGLTPGNWSEGSDGTWAFNASPDNLRAHTPDQLLNYFQAYEQNKQYQPDGSFRYGAPNRVTLPGSPGNPYNRRGQ